MKRMLVFRYVALVVLVLCTLTSQMAYGDQHAAGGAEGNKMFTAYNIWTWPSHNMRCINYKGGRDRIPVGTPVKDVKITPNPPSIMTGYEEDFINSLEFVVAETGKKHVIHFIQSYHPGKTKKDYLEMMFTTKTIDELTDGSNPHVATAIKEGVLIEGMTKEEVFASYGPPSERHTSSMDNNIWIYFINRKSRLKVYFGLNERTQHQELMHMDLLSGRASRNGLKSYPRPIVSKLKTVPQQISTPLPKDDPEYKLNKIKSLYEKGLITEEEYKEKRLEILEGI